MTTISRTTPITCLLASLALVDCSSSSAPGGAKRPEPKHAGTAAKAGRSPTAGKTPKPGEPPRARRQDVVDTIHGQRVADPYRWLENGDDPAVKAWMAAHDRYTRRWLAHLPQRAALLSRIKALEYVEHRGLPRRRGERLFFSRRPAAKEKAIWYYKLRANAKARVLIDPNAMSSDGSVSLRGVFISHDGRKAAYKLSEHNADESTLYVKSVDSGEVSKVDTIPNAKYAEPSWNPNSTGFYYTRLPPPGKVATADRPGHAAVYFHRLGQGYRKDRLIHEKTGDPRRFIYAQMARRGRLLLLYVMHGWTRTDLYFKRLGRDSRWRELAVGLDALFGAEVYRGAIYVHTNHRAPNYRIYRVDPAKPERAAWKEIVAERDDAVLQGFTIVGGRLALRYLRDAATVLRIARLDGKVVRTIALPGVGTASRLSGEPDDPRAFYSFSSFIHPPVIYRTSVRSKKSTLHFESKVPVDSKRYVVEQEFYRSKDNTRIPMFIVRSKKLNRDGSAPLLLTGYGGFNIDITPYFSPAYFLWLEAGGLVAIPTLRGGGEYGEVWHRAGMRQNKQNVFDDFIGAAEHLIDRRYTSRDRIAIRGRSNGGLLVGAAMTQRPDLFRAVSCHVPLLDMVRYHLFGSGKTWISEYGSADDPEQFKALYAYSPYHRVKPNTAYPALLMFTSPGDDRVHPMHARKFFAAVRHATTSGRPVLLRVDYEAGHGGGDRIEQLVQERADEFAFLFSQLGMKPSSAKNR